MTVLSDKAIKERLNYSVIIEPFDERNVNTSSYDVTLGEYYYEERRPSLARRLFGSVYNMWEYQDIRRVWDGPYEAMTLEQWRFVNPRLYRRDYAGFKQCDKVIFLPPKRTILAHTQEFIGGRNCVTTMMKARSSFGRNFIEVCKCAGYGDVGYFNRWTMEITNNSQYHHIPLVVGRRIAQIVFFATDPVDGDYTATGKYQTISTLETLKRRWIPSMMLPRLDRDRDNPDLCPHGFLDWDECSTCGH